MAEEERALGRSPRVRIVVVALAAIMAGTSLAVVLVRTAWSLAWPGPVRRPLLLHAALLVLFALLWTAIGDPSPGTAGALAVVVSAALSAGIQGAPSSASASAVPALVPSPTC